VEFSTFHEGRGARKKTTPGGREKNAYFSKECLGKIVGGKEEFTRKNCHRKERSIGEECEYLGKVMLGRAEFRKELFPSLPRITVYLFY